MTPAVPEEPAGKFEKRQVVLCFLVVANQNGAAAIQPPQCAFDHPAARWVACLSLVIKLFFANVPNVRDVSMLSDRLVASRIVIPFIEGQVLRRFRSRLGAVNNDGIQCLCEQLGVVHIGGRHDHGQWATRALDE